jgi:hypothetical protein
MSKEKNWTFKVRGGCFMDIRYTPLEENRIGEICRLWNREIGREFPMNERLLRQNSFTDPNVLPEGSWIAVDASDGHRLAGGSAAGC